MGTNERKGMGGSLVDGLKRRARAPESSPERSEAATPVAESAGRVSVAPERGGPVPVSDLLARGLADELPELGSFGHVPGLPSRRSERREVTATPSLLGFGFVQGRGWLASPQRPFKPRGLYIVGELSTGDRLAQAYVGQDCRTLCSCEGVPAHFFATARSYEQIARAVADGQELPGWGDWGIAYPGVQIWVNVTTRDGAPLGPDRIDLGMWGHVAL